MLLLGASLSLLVLSSCLNREVKEPDVVLAVEPEARTIDINRLTMRLDSGIMLDSLEISDETLQRLSLKVLERHRKDYLQSEHNSGFTSRSFESARETLDAINLMAGQQESKINLSDFYQELRQFTERCLNQSNGCRNTKESLDQRHVKSAQWPKYNKAHSTLYSLFYNKRTQQYASTVFLELARLARGNDQGRQDRAVVIFESGSIRPGQMRWTPQGFELVGFKHVGFDPELGNNLQKNYGLVQHLSGIRVIDSLAFLLTEAYRGEFVNIETVLNRSLELTSDIYLIPFLSIEFALTDAIFKYGQINLTNLQLQRARERLSDPITSTLYSLGSSRAVAAGDFSSTSGSGTSEEQRVGLTIEYFEPLSSFFGSVEAYVNGQRFFENDLLRTRDVLNKTICLRSNSHYVDYPFETLMVPERDFGRDKQATLCIRGSRQNLSKLVGLRDRFYVSELNDLVSFSFEEAFDGHSVDFIQIEEIQSAVGSFARVLRDF